MRVIGLTGSIGMGKTTTAAMFRARGAATHDADRTVHQLYEHKVAARIELDFPGVATDGKVDRAKLAARVAGDRQALARLEAIVHPLVRAEEGAFLERSAARGYRFALVDVPLLFEAGGHERFDFIIVVTADPATQRQRVLARPGMTEGRFQGLLARQIPDSEKRRRAHFIIDTSSGQPSAARQVNAILRCLASTC